MSREIITELGKLSDSLNCQAHTCRKYKFKYYNTVRLSSGLNAMGSGGMLYSATSCCNHRTTSFYKTKV